MDTSSVCLAFNTVAVMLVVNFSTLYNLLNRSKIGLQLTSSQISDPSFVILKNWSFAALPLLSVWCAHCKRYYDSCLVFVTKSVNALVSINCLEKKQDNDDARIKWLSITPVGLDKLNEARQLTGPFMFGAFGVIDPNQIESFCENLKKMKQYLDEQRV
ncbi:hypothetical protein [Marinicellulosiphila megalodicopiae]|uniref:hypothetical protein n=1 Tax=Marinicellulosiphila megalodicopiae TaxID=2724896 RepID=UPI003BB11B58